MPYIKKSQRELLDRFVDNLLQGLDCEDIDGKLNYVISRLVSASYCKSGKWKYATIQRVMGLFHCVSQEFYHRIAVPYEAEAEARNGDIKEYDEADGQLYYKIMARRVVERFPPTGTYKRSEFDQMLANCSTFDRIDDFTNRLHHDGYITMGTDVVVLGTVGLELRR